MAGPIGGTWANAVESSTDAVSLETGLQYVRGKQLFTATVAKAILRDRTQSYPDTVYGTHGDAAFADYVWLASYSVRFGGHGHAAHHDMPDTAHSGAGLWTPS